MSTVRGNARRKRVDSTKEVAEQTPANPNQSDIPTPLRRGRKAAVLKEDMVESKVQTQSPKMKKRKVEFDKTRLTQTDEEPEKTKGNRSRNSSATDLVDPVESHSSARSSRNRQPSRRMMESKISEELVKEQLANPRKRLTSHKEMEIVETDQIKPEMDAAPEHHPVEEEVKKEEGPPKLRKMTRKKLQKDFEQEEHPPLPQPTVVDQPRVVFKTVTQQPELPKEALIVGGKKPYITTTTATSLPTKPLLPIRSVPPKAGSTPVIIPRPAGGSRAGEKAKEPHITPSKAPHVPVEKTKTLVAQFTKAESSKAAQAEAKFIQQSADNVQQDHATNEEVVESHSEAPEGSQQLTEKKSDTVIPQKTQLQEDDESPPQLQAEKPTHDEFPRSSVFVEGGSEVRCQSPGGTMQYVTVARGEDGTEVYLDENGEEVQMVEDVGEDLRTVEFNFLDSKNICCGLCGEIVPYDTLMSHHLPQHHPDILGNESGGMNLEEIPYESWLKDKLLMDKRSMEGGFRYEPGMGGDEYVMRMRGHRPLRKVSQIRVNPIEMDMEQLNHALNKKMVEKMGRKVPVTLVDKQHAKCGICNAVVSLNKKFEIVHLVRHFNAWHPSAHRCAGSWQHRPPQVGCGKPLSIQDFAVIDVNMETPDNLQCIWCGMFMDRNALAMHFTEVHPEEIEVPKCLLCLSELVINARLLEKYGEDFEVVLPDEHHVKSMKFGQTYSTEQALDRAIAKRMQKINASANNPGGNEDDDDEEEVDKGGTVTNSRMTFGRKNKPKRSFVQPSFRQAVPVNSKYVEPVTECQWRCKLCKGNIFGAVISAGAIKHYKQFHPGEMENMQYELCKARLDRVSGGCMEFVHPQLVECLICNLTYALHKPYNMCRGIRHLKLKHPNQMPENKGSKANDETEAKPTNVRLGEIIDDPEMVARFKSEYHVDFEKVQAVYGEDNEPVYVLLGADETLDPRTASQMITSLGEGGNDGPSQKRVVVGPRASMAAGYDDEDPYGDLAEDEEMAEMETKPDIGRSIAHEGEVVENVVRAEYIPGSKVPKLREIVEQNIIEDGAEFQDGEVVDEEAVEYQYEYDEQVEFVEGEEGQFLEEGYVDEYQDEQGQE